MRTSFQPGARRPSPSEQAGSGRAGSPVGIGGGRPRSRSPGQETAPPLLTSGSMSSSVPRVPRGRKGRGHGAAAPGPASSRPLATQSTSAPGSDSHNPAPHPPLLNSNGCHHTHLRSARRGQSSPSPQQRANRSALRLPRPHPWGRSRRLATLPAPFRLRSSPHSSSGRHAALPPPPATSEDAWLSHSDVTAAGGRTPEERNRACAH